jgi:hypothetical protein
MTIILNEVKNPIIFYINELDPSFYQNDNKILIIRVTFI